MEISRRSLLGGAVTLTAGLAVSGPEVKSSAVREQGIRENPLTSEVIASQKKYVDLYLSDFGAVKWKPYRPMRGFFADLTDEQKTRALDYRGDENHEIQLFKDGLR